MCLRTEWDPKPEISSALFRSEFVTLVGLSTLMRRARKSVMKQSVGI